MFTLIIVHADPEWLQRLVEEMMPWRQHRVDKIVTAVDGPAALRAAIASRPELILSDSELHGASGADWVNEYAATGNPFQVAFFCAREDFGFARAAMRLKAVDCLPMPVTPAQLERTIADMIGELERPSGLNLQMWLNAQTLLQRSFADSLLQGTRFYSDQTFREHARSLRMEWLDEGCRVLAIRMTEDPSDATSAGERRLAAYAADNVIQELAGRHARSVIVTSGTGEWIYIAASEEPEADIGIVAEEWIEAVRQYTHARIRIGLSGRSARWNELPRLLSQAVEALSFADTLDGHSVLRYERTAAHMPETRGSDERRLLRELLAGNKAGVRQWLEDLPRDAFGPQDGVALAESAWKWLAGLHRFLESSGAMHGGGDRRFAAGRTTSRRGTSQSRTRTGDGPSPSFMRLAQPFHGRDFAAGDRLYRIESRLPRQAGGCGEAIVRLPGLARQVVQFADEQDLSSVCDRPQDGGGQA
ncbi:hypothetical protein [Cohnella rhizosphaerae]|uniref:Response regulatory domain-containing protein n=1 Tax=Cohnella rhizosphaerae TaxID=1457232 RepID=A0A9X4KXX4_9BACL|nr:hypothetical protein [Cohnella rhizosphaerae]MDG0813334.1 hypothetical protein [Cohnella rhizosphaerae]